MLPPRYAESERSECSIQKGLVDTINKFKFRVYSNPAALEANFNQHFSPLNFFDEVLIWAK